MVLGLWVIAGIMGFFLLEKAMRNYSGEAHGHSHAKAPAKPAIRVEDTKAVASPRASRRSMRQAVVWCSYQLAPRL
jgi:hypothetical protein